MPQSSRLNWRLILALALAGVPFAALTILGLVSASTTRWLVPLLPLAVGVVAGSRCPDRAVAHGFLAAFFAAVVFVELQALFLPWYFENNPQYRSIPIPFGMSARFATAVLGPANAVLAGVVGSAAAWASGRLSRRITPRSETP